MDDLHHPSQSGSFPHLGPSITVTKVVSSSLPRSVAVAESSTSPEILERMEDEEDVKIEEDDIKIEDDDIKIEEENLQIEVVDDVNREDTETENICDLCQTVFKSVKSLQRHKKVKHDTCECICPECGISVVGMQKLAHYRN